MILVEKMFLKMPRVAGRIERFYNNIVEGNVSYKHTQDCWVWGRNYSILSLISSKTLSFFLIQVILITNVRALCLFH